MRAALRHRRLLVAAFQRADIGEMLVDRHAVAFLFADLGPLIMVVKNDRYQRVEVDHEAVARGVVDQPVETLVEHREIGVARLDLLPQQQVVAIDDFERPPGDVAFRELDELLHRTQFKQFANLGQFQRELLGEALDDPAAAWPALQQAELAEAVEVFPDHGSGDAKLAGEFETVDLLSRLAIALQNPLHEAFLDDVADRLRFDLRIVVGLDRTPAHDLLAPAEADQFAPGQLAERRPNGRPADVERRRERRFGTKMRADRSRRQQIEARVVGASNCRKATPPGGRSKPSIAITCC